ncbi:type I restriction endonuclease subunit R [Vibrio parahaemolyticus]|uniref:restriction endonuclease subunit S n=1 Tax=Vibrio parahaemolyticus TaxID=670 RepID=UPI0011246082|nr:restriction endonuclease subunit S [Vibrio parahaemolyticus]MCI9691851.1 restriction endonuclease subunit S [Vibrio parahaemolyticus]TOL64199.1 type I restriction endonuclease subunit R [Vibrio parahaemolyticus]
MVPNGWEKRDLQGLITVKHGFAFKSEFFTDSGNFVLLTPGSFNESGGFKDQGKKTKYYVGDVPDGYLLKKGDMLLAMTEQAEGLLGSALFVPDDNKYLHNQRLGLVQVTSAEQVTIEFLYLFFNAPASRKQITEQSTGTKVKHTSPDRLCSVIGLIPPLPEQKKIAQILSVWDKAITNTEQLITNSQQQKKALMQQLLTGKKRLGLNNGSFDFQRSRYGLIPKDWEYLAIKDICTQVTEKNTESSDYPVLSCSKYDGFVDSLKYFKKKVYSDDTSGYRLIHRDCFGFPSNHIEEGSIGLQNLYDTGIVSPIYVVFRANPKKVDNAYLYAVLKTDHYRQIFGAATNASVDRRGSLRWKEFSLIHVPLPPLEEQQKIAAVLSIADQEITTLQQKLEALKLEKKALMQQLLTGKRRVLVS